MSNKIDRTKTGTSVQVKGLGKRGIAIVLCFVMLLTALGTGSLLSTAAVSQSDDSNASEIAMDAASALVKAAANGADAVIPDEVINDFDDEPFVDDIEDGYDIHAKVNDTASDVSAAEYYKDYKFTREEDADLAESGYNLEYNSRIYLDAHLYFGNADGTNVKSNVYFVVQYASDKKAAIIKMSHIANTQLYTCYTSSSNCYSNTAVSCVYFFTTDDEWGTKEYVKNDSTSVYAHINGNLSGGKISNTYNMNITANYVYYFYLASNSNLTVSSHNDVYALPNNSASGELRGGQHKASVYTSTDDSTYAYDSDQTHGGDVQVGGYGWSTGYVTTAKTFATSSKTSSDGNYSYFDTPAKTSWITLRVNEVYDGYIFKGWYNKTSGALINASTEYSYRVDDTSDSDIVARFYKPTYNTATPAAKTVQSGTAIFNNASSATYAWWWQDNPSSVAASFVSLLTTSAAAVKTYGFSTDIYSQPKAIATNGNNWDNNPTKYSDDIEIASDKTYNGIYYINLPGSTDNNNEKWSTFTHLGAPSVSSDDTDYDLGDTVTLTATAPTDGTLKDVSGMTYSYYFTTDGGSTYKQIASDVTSTTQAFYPPDNGSYQFLVTATDGAGLETTLSSLSTAVAVGGVGYYVAGNTALTGSNWTQFSSKGAMTNTSGTVWTKTFTAVAAGTHEFRITDITKTIGSDGWTSAGDYTLTGNGVTLTTSGDNVSFTLAAKSKVTITFDPEKVSNKYPVTVTVQDVVAVPVTVYAGSNGSVTVTYGSATTEIDGGENSTIYVAEGESIDLLAEPSEGYSFNKWAKNLSDPYQIESANAGASISGETITKKTIYVAYFTAGSGDLDFDDSGYSTVANVSLKYSSGSGGSSYTGSSGTAIGGTIKQNGNNYWIVLSASDLTAWKTAASTGQVYWNMFNSGDSSMLTDKSGTTIDSSTHAPGVTSKMENYSTNVFVELSGLTSNISALGLLVNPTDKKVTYYTSTSSSGGTDDDYVPTVSFYAKDTIYYMRDGSPYEVNYMGDIDTTVTEVEDEIDVTEYGTAWEAGTMLKGSKITVTTTIPTTGSLTATNSSGTNVTVTPAQKYYVVGFSFNGYTPQILEENNTGVYTCTYTIPTNMSEEMLEITPIFFIREAYAGNTVTFHLDGYEELKSEGWGNTLFVYPFYHRYKNNNNDKTGGDTTYYGQAENFGGYPGQPVINNGGQLYTQIPLTCNGTKAGIDATGNEIKGVTINNGYFDKVHQDYCGFVSVHKQTYDYDDFAKIYYEKNASGLHAIKFSFKFHAENSSYQHRAYNTTSNTDSKSRYNDMYATTGTHHSLGATTTASALTSYVTAENPWEDLTDSLGNKVDLFGNSVDTSKYPVYVVSMGYEYNNSGEYATEWAIYTTTNGTNYSLVKSTGIDTTNTGDAYNSSIVPSALVMNSADSFTDYVAMDGDQSIQGYKNLYTTLTSYAGSPVKIVYEYDAYISYNNPHAYRSDGRWTYTTDKDYVRSGIEIQYKAKGATEYAIDTFTNTNEGETSGCKAYFTNSDYYGAVTSDSELISNTAYYNFTAETAGSYQFAGWYLKDVNGKESPVTTTDLSSKSLRSGNYTFIARFDYVANGTLTISNSLDSASAGRGTTYLGVTLIYGGQETVRASVNSNTEPVTLDSSIIKSNSNYQIKIDIRTVPNGENTFGSYTCYTTNGSGDSDVKSTASDTDIYNSSNASNATDSYTITVSSDLYSSGDQVVKAIEYVSSLNAVKYDYSIRFNYTSRQYGSQAFTRTGTLSPAQIDDINVVTGTLNKTDNPDKKLTKSYLQKIAPHESNFNTSISWNFDTLYSAQSCTYNSSTNTYSISATATSATETANVTRTGYFTVPYVLSSETGDNGIALADEGKVAKAEEDQTFTINVNYDELFYASDNNFVTAPKVIYEDVEGVKTPRYFKYWEMSTVTGTRGESRVVSKCYFPEFNYRALDNYNITAVYSDDEDEDITENSYADFYNEGKSTTVAFIGNSRNQWNNGNKGSNVNDAGDLIYNDFIFTFKPEGNDLFKDISGAQCGMIIQKVKPIEINSSGKNAKTLQEYAKDFSTADLAAAKTAAQAKVGGTSTAGYNQSKVTFSASGVNDKNRMHYAFSMYNSKNGTATTNAQYLYRAYSYMAYTRNGVSTTVVSEEPAYFYMYDIATE